jgi:hypothetical protein
VTDFVGLVRAARELPGQDTSDRLWAAWCALPAWHVLAAPSPVGPLPFSNFVDGQRSVLAFTAVDGAENYAQVMRVGPVTSVPPDGVLAKFQQLRMYGVTGFLVDVGPNGFMTTLDKLWSMFHRFKSPAPPAPAPSGPVPGSLAWFRALPAWHVAVTPHDRSVPELATQDGDLIGQVFSHPQYAGSLPVVAMPPAQALALFTDMELVTFVRFDNHLVVDLVDAQI